MPAIEENDDSVDYFLWLNRVLGWDAVLPLLVSAASVLIVKTLPKRPPTDIIALLGLPVLAFLLRWAVGHYQISRNKCTRRIRRIQQVSLVLALFILAFIDFFIALAVVLPPGNAQMQNSMVRILSAISLTTYVTLVTFAMYPGRHSTKPASRRSQQPRNTQTTSAGVAYLVDRMSKGAFRTC